MAKYVDRKSGASPVPVFEFRPGRVDDLINYLGDDLKRLEYVHPRGAIEAVSIELVHGGKRLLQHGEFLIPAGQLTYDTMSGDDFRRIYRRVGIAGELYLKVGEPFEAVRFYESTVLETIALALTHDEVTEVTFDRSGAHPCLRIVRANRDPYTLYDAEYLVSRKGDLCVAYAEDFAGKYTAATV